MQTGFIDAARRVKSGDLPGGARLPPGLVRALTPAQAERLAGGLSRHVFRTGRILVYRDHIPYVTYLLLEGAVGFELGRGTRLARSVTPRAPAVLGGGHAAQRRAFPVTLRVTEPVVACLLNADPAPHRRTDRANPGRT